MSTSTQSPAPSDDNERPGLTVAQLHERLGALIQQGQGNSRVGVPYHRGTASIGATPTMPIVGARAGFDWDTGTVFVTPHKGVSADVDHLTQTIHALEQRMSHDRLVLRRALRMLEDRSPLSTAEQLHQVQEVLGALLHTQLPPSAASASPSPTAPNALDARHDRSGSMSPDPVAVVEPQRYSADTVALGQKRTAVLPHPPVTKNAPLLGIADTGPTAEEAAATAKALVGTVPSVAPVFIAPTRTRESAAPAPTVTHLPPRTR